MSLRPRYSLLTLLIITTIVSVGTWYWFKPTRYILNLKQAWDQRAKLEPLQEDLLQAGAFSAQQIKGFVIYETRRTLGGEPEFLAAKFCWESRPLLVSFKRLQANREVYLLTSPLSEISLQEIQANAQQFDLTSVSSEKVLCWVSTQVKHLNYVQVDHPNNAAGLCQLPVCPDPQAGTSYLLTVSGKIYQLNSRDGQCDLIPVVLDQVTERCRAMLSEEIRTIEK